MLQFEPWNKYEQDLEIFVGRFIRQKLEPLCWPHVMDLHAEVACSDEPVAFADVPTLTFRPIREGEAWASENFACGWFHLTGKLPEGTDRKDLCLEFFNDGEGLLVDADGNPVKGFTAGSPVFGAMDESIEKRFYPLDGFIDADGNIDCYIDGASNSLLGEFHDAAKLKKAAVVRKNAEYLDLYYDFDTLYDYVTGIDYENPNKLKVLYGLREAENLIKYQDPDFYPKAKEIFNQLYALPGTEKLTATAVAHAHLDLAWLWPIRETKRKAKRTFSNFIHLSEQYPDFRFVVSQPQQLAWMKEEEPELYRKLQELAKKGNLEPIGGGWVENDTNLPGEESLVRQMLYGQKFWQEEFGSYVRTCWLPDAFGYTGALPQILKQSGQDNFMTIKISWSNRTVFPYNTFRWAGIDGSEVTVHMPPEGNYNSLAGPKALLAAKKGIKKTDPHDKMMLVYGIGDGGGGPSEVSVERCLRTKDIPYLPHSRFGTAQAFFDDLDPDTLQRYEGEMYLEKHRGTYTSQSRNKWANREFEERMSALETLLSARGQYGDTETVNTLWKEALLYQFHDILPGSSISRVYQETSEAYPKMLHKLEELAKQLGVSYCPGGNLINPGREDVFFADFVSDRCLLYRGNGNLIAPQVLKRTKDAGRIDSYQTEFYRVEFAKDGSFARITLPTGEVIAENANRLRVFIDTGDAWDFEDDYRDQREVYMELERTEVQYYEDLVEIQQDYTFKNSTLTQTILMYKKHPLIQIMHSVSWNDVGYMVRAEFAPKVWSDTVHSDIQFGYLDRPTTDNTAHEKAQFEICCSKWFDISEDTAGLSVLNYAKNGFMAKQGILSLNLLRSTDYPCTEGERLPFWYAYALYPHKGGFDPLKTDVLAQQFSAAPLFGDLVLEMPSFDNQQIQITAFKPAYDGDGFILRAFERIGKPAETKLTLPQGWVMDSEVNLLEDTVGEAEQSLSFRPFQIRSFRLRKAAEAL